MNRIIARLNQTELGATAVEYALMLVAILVGAACRRLDKAL